LWGSCVGGIFWLHYLLKANLVGQNPRFGLSQSLKARLLNLWAPAAVEQK
jgi:hypothetical protein